MDHVVRESSTVRAPRGLICVEARLELASRMAPAHAAEVARYAGFALALTELRSGPPRPSPLLRKSTSALSLGHHGLAAIRSWMKETLERYDYQVDPLESSRTGKKVVVLVSLRGTFPGSPIALQYNFHPGG